MNGKFYQRRFAGPMLLSVYDLAHGRRAKLE